MSDKKLDVSRNNFDSYKHVQSIAKDTIRHLSTIIKPGITESNIKNEAERYMLSHGIESFWYYNVGAFVFVGNRTTISISGKDYIPTEQKVGQNDIVTVDLSPCIGKAWGDYARTLIIGKNNLSYGIEFQQHLHKYLSNIINSEMTFHELYHEMNSEIERNGFMNLDFNGNLGHTIEDSLEKRKYIASGNMIKVKDIELFTFEPHIQKKNENCGFKMENIYYLEKQELKEL
jgi:methionine aminopeptidase